MIGGRATGGRRHGLLWIVVGVAMAAGVWLVLQRGVWLDETFSVFYAGHDLGFTQALRDRWLRDEHPPFYQAYSWLLQPVFGADVQHFRLINLGFLLPAAATVVLTRTPEERRFLLLFAALTATTPFFLLYLAEFRSYGLGLGFSACLLAQLRMVVDREMPGIALWLTLALTALVLVNLHYVASLCAFAILGAAVLVLAARARWAAAGALVAIATVAAALLGTTLLMFLSTTIPLSVNETGMAKAAVLALAALGAGLICNPAAALASVPAARRMVENPRGAPFAVLTLIALIAIFLLFMAYNLAAHNFVIRFVVAAVPLTSALLADLLTRSGGPGPRATAAISMCALVSGGLTVAYGLSNRRWETNVPLIQAERARCPTTRVVGLDPLSFMDPHSAQRNWIGLREAVPLAYRMIGDRYGFPVVTAERGTPVTMLDADCPTLVWVEHRYVAPIQGPVELMRTAGLRSPTGRAEYRVLQAEPSRILLWARAAPQ